MWKTYTVIALLSAYLIDRLGFDGKYYAETQLAANKIVLEFDYRVKNLLKPTR